MEIVALEEQRRRNRVIAIPYSASPANTGDAYWCTLYSLSEAESTVPAKSRKCKPACRSGGLLVVLSCGTPKEFSTQCGPIYNLLDYVPILLRKEGSAETDVINFGRESGEQEHSLRVISNIASATHIASLRGEDTETLVSTGNLVLCPEDVAVPGLNLATLTSPSSLSTAIRTRWAVMA